MKINDRPISNLIFQSSFYIEKLLLPVNDSRYLKIKDWFLKIP